MTQTINALPDERLHALDTVRGFALLLGVAFHASLSFMPGWPPGLWAMADNSPSAFLSDAAFVAHVFRMTLFFFIAGYFARMLLHKAGAVGFWRNRGKRIVIPMLIGWVILIPLLHHIWMAGITKQLGGLARVLPDVPKTAGSFPLLHLWFLYQLLLFYVLASAVLPLVARIDSSHTIRRGIDTATATVLKVSIAPFVLGVPVAVALLALPVWFYWSGIPTPDQSLIPQTASSVAYGVAFFVGWAVQCSSTAIALIRRNWWLNLFVGTVATMWLSYTLHTVGPVATPGTTTIAFAYLFGVASWALTLGVTGAALRFLSGFSATRRYISDASYWIYLVHLPVVAALQVWVGQWSLHWTIKFPLVLAASFALLFASYHLFVRSTPIGLLLNGRQYPFKLSKSVEVKQGAVSAATLANCAQTVSALEGVSKSFGPVVALKDVSIALHEGEVHALLGPNGAGKSTAISMWLGLLQPDAGNVSLLGGSPNDVTRREGLGVMLQDVDLPKELRVSEMVRLASSYYSDPLPIDEVLARAGAENFARRGYGQLSGGQKRLAQYAVAICGRPRVLFLDEPSAGLDVRARETLWDDIRKMRAAGVSIVLTTHYLEEAEALADRVTFIAKGVVVASGTVEQIHALVARRRIGCETSISPEIIRDWPSVTDVFLRHDQVNILAADAEDVVRRLLAADPHLQKLEVQRIGLSEAFNELTKEAA